MYLTRPTGGSWNKGRSSAIDQARLDGLNFTADALLRAGVDRSQLLGAMSDQIAVLEREARRRVVFKDGANAGPWFEFEARRGDDYIRMTKPNEVRLLNARIEGVILSANLMKPRAYNHDNAHVARSLRKLADAIESAQIRLADQDGELKVD